MSKKLNIGIVGAGIQGVSNALFLQKKGFEKLFLIEIIQEAQQRLMVMQVISHLTHLYH